MAKTTNLDRQLHGTAFLSLEHWSYMALVVIIPILLLAGFNAAMAIWTNRPENLTQLGMMGAPLQMMVDTPIVATFAVLAALLVLSPLLFVFQRRTQAEIAKRPGYTQRVAYKLPVYGALVLLAICKTAALIGMVAVLLNALALIGVKNADISGLFTGLFLPALLAYVVFFAAGWYVFKLAKGKNYGPQFAFIVTWAAALMVVMLFTTAIMATHDKKQSQPSQTTPTQLNPQFWVE